MTRHIVVGLDGSGESHKALAVAKDMAQCMGKEDCKIVLITVVEWSPYKFQTPQENALRHQRKKEEVDGAFTQILNPALDDLKADGFQAEAFCKHGDAAELINDMAEDLNANHILIGRTGRRDLKRRLFGGVAHKLAIEATIPVTIVP